MDKVTKDVIGIDDLKKVLSYDPETGEFTWLVNKGHKKQGDIAGTVVTRKGYTYKNIMINRKLYIASRLAWYYMTGEWPVNEIDHINHVSTDNRWINLRHVTRQENAKNMKRHRNNKTGITGVIKFQDKWLSTICVNGKLITLYRGYDFKEACEKRLMANDKYNFHENHGTKKVCSY